MRTGFVTVVGRPNVGKSTLVNRMVGAKVSITSARPNTTRRQVRGVLHLPAAQVVLVDTPGLHRPRTPLGHRLNDAATATLEDVDVAVVLVEATSPVGPGDRTVLDRVLRAPAGESGPPALLVGVNKVDGAPKRWVLERLASVVESVDELSSAAGAADRAAGAEYFPVSAVTGQGVDELVGAIVDRLPEGPRYYPEDMVSDAPEALWVAELVREQLLRRVRDELPHAIACRVTEWEWPVVRCEILVERPSQKGIVIGTGGQVLKSVGTAVRAELPPGAYLELVVKVERRWQQRDEVLDRLGY